MNTELSLSGINSLRNIRKR